MGTKSQRFRGVRQRQWGSWVSEIRHPITKKRVWLGTFHSAEEAALAYDDAARFISGANAKTNFPSNSYSSQELRHCRLSHALREKLRRCCHMEFSPTRQLSHAYHDPSQDTHNMNATHNLTGSTAKQSSCRNVIDRPRYAIFSNWNDLSELGSSSSEELGGWNDLSELGSSSSEELGGPPAVASEDQSSQINSNEMRSFSEKQQIVACDDTRTTGNESQLDDYCVAEMINELLNCTSTFDLDLDFLHLP